MAKTSIDMRNMMVATKGISSHEVRIANTENFVRLYIYIYIIIIIIIKNEKIRVTLCENAAGALYIVNKMCVDGLRNVEG